MTSAGYGGQALKIDLSTGDIIKEPTDTSWAMNFIGGFGMCQRLAYEYMPPGVDPWAPEAPIVICPGFLNGTLAPSSCKVCMTTKEPASGSVSTWFGSLHFGMRLKWAGYDSLVITGKAPHPVYLRIMDDEVEICDARDLWGKKDLFETVDTLKEKHGPSSSVAAIGPAGENMVKISMVFIDKGTSWGRAAGSTWGSKNLKAILVEGTKGVGPADPKGFMKIVDGAVTRAMADPMRDNWKKMALYSIFHLWEDAGYMTTRNQRETTPKEIMLGTLGTKAYVQRVSSIFGCPSCVAPDKAVVTLKEGPHKGLRVPLSTAIDPALAFGSRLKIHDLDSVMVLWDVSDRAGIDALTFTALLSWAIELYEEGILTKEDTDGLELKEGYEVAEEVLQQTVENRGFGSVLAKGFKAAEAEIGRESWKYALETKGTEPDFDARSCLGLEVFTSQVNVRPSRDLPVGGLTVAKGRKPSFFQKVIKATGYVPEERFDQILTSEGFDLPRLTPYYENWACILDMMGICFRMQSSSLWNVKAIAALYSFATGVRKGPEDLLRDAERAYTLARFLNGREGFDRDDDRFSDRYFEPLKRPDREMEETMTDYYDTKTITREDSEQMLSDYYDERGWDIRTGLPTKEKLLELGLDGPAQEMERG
jgi:aldehyde:ferredoxin oxidoreductase